MAAEHHAGLTVAIEKAIASLPELQELFLPFRSVEYESGTSMRSAIGLYLCREILRIHNGQIRVQQVSEARPEFVVELPA
jgi:K+-sensing histidine kinase KdpD